MFLRFLLAGLLLFLLAGPLLAGVHLLPGNTGDQFAAGPRSLALLTFELPEGLLVVDRRGPGDGPPLPVAAFTPRFEAAEWYLVDRGRDPIQTADPATFGHVHLAGQTAWVVEVPRARLEDFFAAGFRLHFLDLTPMAPAPAVARAEPSPLTVDPALKAAYLDGLDQDAFDQLIREITGDTFFWHDDDLHSVSTRYYNTAGNDLVADYLAQKLAGYGYTVELDTFTVSGHICRNVVATRVGSSLPGETVVVGGHYDSTSQQPGTLAPGAEDNASGTSLVMEVARISADRQFDRTVQFVLFDAEEQGLRGSLHFVAEAVGEGREIIAAITADMVAFYDANYGVIIEGQTAWEWLMTVMADNVAGYTDLDHRKDYFSWGSDHVSFQQAGIAAFLAIDWDWSDYPYYHRTTDTWPRIAPTAPIGLQIARASAATLADVAGLLPQATSAPESTPVAAPLILTAHPNPFNPRTTLTFSLAGPSAGELAIYDLTGRKLAILSAGTFAAGSHTWTWDGLDHGGRALPSGVYLGRLRTGSVTASAKLNLVR